MVLILSLKTALELVDLGQHFRIRRKLLAYLLYSADHRRVVTAIEDPSDHRVRVVVEHVANEIHRDMAGVNKWAKSLCPTHFLDRESIKVGHDRSDSFRFEHDLLSAEVREMSFGEFEADWLLAEVGKGSEHGNRALELADVVTNPLGDPLGDVVGQGDALSFGLRTENCDSCFEVRLINLGDEALEQAATKRSCSPARSRGERST